MIGFVVTFVATVLFFVRQTNVLGILLRNKVVMRDASWRLAKNN